MSALWLLSLRLLIDERIERLEEVAERWDVPGGSKRLALRARDKADGLRVAQRLLVNAYDELPSLDEIGGALDRHGSCVWRAERTLAQSQVVWSCGVVHPVDLPPTRGRHLAALARDGEPDA